MPDNWNSNQDDFSGLYWMDGDNVDEWLSALEEAGAPPADEWTNYDIYLGDGATIDITDSDGNTWTYDAFSGDLTADNLPDWNWIFDIWDWLGDYHPDVDKDSEYAE